MAKTTNNTLERSLFAAADKLRKNVDAAEYKNVVLGLIFLKYISDSFDELYSKLKSGEDAYAGADPEDKDEYLAENVFFVPGEARWTKLLAKAKLPTIGQDLDAAMDAIERENSTLKGILPKVYARPNLDKNGLGQLIDLIGTIALGDEASRSKDILGRVYEYFLGEFASAEGKKGGQFYTPKSIVHLLVMMLEPYEGRVYDPCCGSGGMFVMSEKFVEGHRGSRDNIAIYGQESNETTYRLCRMNLAIRGIDGSGVKWNSEGSFLKDANPDLKADFILANPPFNQKDWGQEILHDDARWQYGMPRKTMPIMPGYSTCCTTSRQRVLWGSFYPTVPCLRIPPARAISAKPSLKLIWWTASSPCPSSCFTIPVFRPACGSCRETRQPMGTGNGKGRSCSSMPLRWALW